MLKQYYQVYLFYKWQKKNVHFVFICFYKSGPHFDEVDESFLSLFSESCMCEDLGLWRQRDNRQTDRQLVMRTNRPIQTVTQRQTEYVRKASYGVETLWETKAQGQWNDCFWLQQFNTQEYIYTYIYICLFTCTQTFQRSHNLLNTHIHTYFSSLSKPKERFWPLTETQMMLS